MLHPDDAADHSQELGDRISGIGHAHGLAGTSFLVETLAKAFDNTRTVEKSTSGAFLRPRMSRAGKKATSLYESEIWRNKNAKKSELLEYLESLHEDLSKVEQDISHAPKGLHAAAAHLVSPKFMENIDRDIRIIVTCCVVDVLRIYAPEAPYKDEDMIRVFEAISKQISSLQTTNPETPAGKRILYILNNIATVKSCLVPVLLDQKGVPAANEVVESMFSAVISIVNSSSTEEG